jgi:hypothetical protein
MSRPHESRHGVTGFEYKEEGRSPALASVKVSGRRDVHDAVDVRDVRDVIPPGLDLSEAEWSVLYRSLRSALPSEYQLAACVAAFSALCSINTRRSNLRLEPLLSKYPKPNPKPNPNPSIASLTHDQEATA